MEYNERVLDHFYTPRNIGEIKDPDGLATVGDPSCGDFIKVWIKVKDDVIEDFKYKVFGCGAAIATTSVVSEMVIGKSVKKATEYTDDDVLAFLGGLPSSKKHCSLLGIRGLHAALSDAEVKENHAKYAERIELFRTKGYNIPQARARLLN
jgi:nitrogen fixation NifU-like protein